MFSFPSSWAGTTTCRCFMCHQSGTCCDDKLSRQRSEKGRPCESYEMEPHGVFDHVSHRDLYGVRHLPAVGSCGHVDRRIYSNARHCRTFDLLVSYEDQMFTRPRSAGDAGADCDLDRPLIQLRRDHLRFGRACSQPRFRALDVFCGPISLDMAFIHCANHFRLCRAMVIPQTAVATVRVKPPPRKLDLSKRFFRNLLGPGHPDATVPVTHLQLFVCRLPPVSYVRLTFAFT